MQDNYTAADEKDIEMLIRQSTFDIEKFIELATYALRTSVGVNPTVHHHIQWVKDMYKEL